MLVGKVGTQGLLSHGPSCLTTLWGSWYTSSLGRLAVVCADTLQILKQFCHFSWGPALSGAPRLNLLGRYRVKGTLPSRPHAPARIPVYRACAAPISLAHTASGVGVVVAGFHKSGPSLHSTSGPRACTVQRLSGCPPLYRHSRITLGPKSGSRQPELLLFGVWRRETCFSSVKKLLPGDRTLSGLCQKCTWGLTSQLQRGWALTLPQLCHSFLAVYPQAPLALQKAKAGAASSAQRQDRLKLRLLCHLWLWQRAPLPREAEEGRPLPTRWA